MFSRVKSDKWRHVIAGVPMGFLLQGLATWFIPTRPVLATAIVLLLVCAISYGFELFSKISGKGHYELADAIATVIGGVMGIAVAIGILQLAGGLTSAG